MSSLWTPGGEHPVARSSSEPASGPAPGAPAEPALTADEEATLADAAGEMAAIRQQLGSTPVELVVTNHIMGLYELAAIHLNRDQPDLASARLAIDALAGALDSCKGRLGDYEATLSDARAQLQMAFVNVANWLQEQDTSG